MKQLVSNFHASPELISPKSVAHFFPKSVAHFPKVRGSFSQSRWLIFPKSAAHFPKVGGSFSQSRWLTFPKSVAHFPKVGGSFSQSRWLTFPKSVTEFRKIGDGLPQNGRWVSLESVPDFLQKPNQIIAQNRSLFFLLDQHQSLPKAYFLLLLQFRISTHSPKGQEHRKKKNCIPQIFSRFSFHFTSIFHFPSCQNDNSACAHKSIPQTNHHFNEFLPLHFPCLVPGLGETLR